MKMNLIFELEQKVSEEIIHKHTGNIIEMVQENDVHMMMKQVKQKEQSLEKLRMIAGEAAKLAKQYEATSVAVNEHTLSKAFSTLDEKEVITAFVEGWELGSYTFDTYKSEKEATSVPIEFKEETSIEKEVSA